MALQGKTNEERIWYFLRSKGLSDYGVAGLMGNLYAESALRPENLQNTYEKKLGMTDAEYTAAVDSGAYAGFVRDSAGYGLAQWTYWSRKEGLLAFAKAAGKSIGDLEMQLGFLWKELSEGYKGVLNVLKAATSVRQASDKVLTDFERPADQSETAKVRRASYGQKYLDKYAAKPSQNGGATMKCTAPNLIAIAVAEIGYMEKETNAQLDNKTANAGDEDYTKYSRDLRAAGYYNGNKQGFAWCDVFVDWCFFQLCGGDAKKAQEVECQTGDCGAGCKFSMQYYQQAGRLFDDPEPGDQIFFTRNGSITHTGIVETVSSTKITTIEGNTSNVVARRTYNRSDPYIKAYGRPRYDGSAATVKPSTGTPEPAQPTGEQVYTVVRGDTLSGIAAKFGTTYQKLATYNGITNVNMIRVGQKIKIPGTAGGEIKVGDVVQFAGGPHYTSANAATAKTSPKAGPAKVTAISKSGKHPYHVIHTTSASTVYGWVDANKITKV